MKKTIALFVIAFIVLVLCTCYLMNRLVTEGPALVGAVAAQVHNAYVRGAK